jgi:hypothetical protein
MMMVFGVLFFHGIPDRVIDGLRTERGYAFHVQQTDFLGHWISPLNYLLLVTSHRAERSDSEVEHSVAGRIETKLLPTSRCGLDTGFAIAQPYSTTV